MNAVGIDVSKGKSMVAIMRPFGEIVSTPFEIKHTSSDINSLVKLIKSIEGESRIVMEHTGRYYEVLAHQLSEANLFVSAINPKLIKDFDNDSLRKVKTDKADSVKIILAVWEVPAIPQIVKGKINAYAPLTIRVLAGRKQTSQNKQKSAV